jgi:serpin B
MSRRQPADAAKPAVVGEIEGLRLPGQTGGGSRRDWFAPRQVASEFPPSQWLGLTRAGFHGSIRASVPSNAGVKRPLRAESLPRAAAVILAAAACCGGVARAGEPASANLQPARTAINSLGIDLLKRMGGVNANAVLSPYSIQTALAMAWAGADGVTHDEMRRVLHFPTDEAILHASMAALRQALETAAARTVQVADRARQSGKQSDPLTLSVANRLFGQDGYAFRQSFLALTRDIYEAPLEALDFKANPDRERRQINRWVEERTRDRIRELIPPGGIEEDTGLVIVNAIHLQAPWQEPFSDSATRPAPFHLQGGRSVEVPTMRHKGQLGFAQRDGYRVVTVPYLGRDLQFVILLPDTHHSLARLESELTADQLAATATVPPAEVMLHLPKLKLEPPLLRLGQELRALGMTTAFDQPRGSADFDRMAPRRPNDYLRISEVFHQTFLALDEKGTEAAAATAVSMVRVTSIPTQPPDPIEVRVDRPFLFAVQHRTSGACLFLGRVVDPR